MRTQWKKGFCHPPASTLYCPLFDRMLCFKSLSSLRQQGADLREFVTEFSGTAEGLGLNKAILKDLLNYTLDEPLDGWLMRGLELLSFGAFVDLLVRHAKDMATPPEAAEEAAAHPVAAEDAAAPSEAVRSMPPPCLRKRRRRKKASSTPQDPEVIPELPSWISSQSSLLPFWRSFQISSLLIQRAFKSSPLLF